MFQIIAIVSLLLVLGAIVLHCLVFPEPKPLKKVSEFPARQDHWWCFWDKDLTLLGRLRRLASLGALGSFLVLFVTGFGPRLLLGHPLEGYGLMLHATLAPVFIICAAVVALAWAYPFRLTEEDRGQCCLTSPALCRKWTFWLAGLLAMAASLSMVVSMFPIFGTHGLEVLLAVHQYSALGLTLLLMLHVYMRYRLSRAAGK